MSLNLNIQLRQLLKTLAIALATSFKKKVYADLRKLNKANKLCQLFINFFLGQNFCVRRRCFIKNKLVKQTLRKYLIKVIENNSKYINNPL